MALLIRGLGWRGSKQSSEHMILNAVHRLQVYQILLQALAAMLLDNNCLQQKTVQK